jgi:hypothetical protein
VLVLLRLDDERRRLVRTLSAAGVHLLVLLTGAGDTTTDESAVPVHSVDPGDVAASLARLGKAA